jgi:hypothetical protein
MLFVDEHGTTSDQVLTFPIVWPPSHVLKAARKTGLEDNEGIEGVLNEPDVGGCQWRVRHVDGVV